MSRYGGPAVLPHEKQNKIERQKERRLAQRSISTNVKTTGITPEEIRALEIAQGYCCALCNKHQKEGKNRLAVDHDHITGKVRGLLCYSCNTKLGWLEKLGLKKVIKYLGGATWLL